MVDGRPPPLSCDADTGRPLPGHYIILCDNLFYKSRSELRTTTTKKDDLFKKDFGQEKRLKLFKVKFLHGFPFNSTQRSANRLTWNSRLQLCASLAHGGLAVLPELAVAVFIALPVCTVQYFLLTWCLVTECSSNDG